MGDLLHCGKFVRWMLTSSLKNLHGVVGNEERFSDKNFSTLLLINSLKFRYFKYLFLQAT